MTIISIGKERESLTFNSEAYKELIRKYMDTMGYSQVTDSFVEGHLSDMIFINPSISIERKTYVEAKSGDVSLSDEKFSNEILNYLAEWLNLPEKNRFNLFIFTKKLENKKEFDKIFGTKYSVTALKSWISKNKKKVQKNTKEIIEKFAFKDIVAFISNITIIEADMNRLTNAIEKKKSHSDLSLEKYAQNLLKDCQRRGKPIKEKNNLISNMVSFTPPSNYFRIKVTMDTEKEIYAYYNKANVEIPPFVINPENNTLCTFFDLKKNNVFKDITKGDLEQIKIDSNVDERFVINLINRHLRRIFWKKGLRRKPETNIYYFECVNKDDVFQIRHCIKNKKGDEKEVSIPLFNEVDGKKELNFIHYHAVEISAKKVWEEYFILIVPRKEYSTDGINLIEGRLKDVIDRNFRNPLFNRSPNILSEIKFWYFYLFEYEKFEKEPEEWFSKFKFRELESVPFGWKPKTVPMGQSVLEEYNEEQYSD